MMIWYHYIFVFLAGFCAVNCIPHLVAGISGEKFQSPFASPPGVGESSAVVNFLWGMANIGFCFGLLALAPGFEFSDCTHVGVFIAGVVLPGAGLAWYFARVRHPEDN